MSHANSLLLAANLKPGFEHAFPDSEDLVSYDSDGVSFARLKLAEFMTRLPQGEVPVPQAWIDRGYPPAEVVRGDKLIGLPDGDWEYLRVSYQVIERFPGRG